MAAVLSDTTVLARLKRGRLFPAANLRPQTPRPARPQPRTRDTGPAERRRPPRPDRRVLKGLEYKPITDSQCRGVARSSR